MGTVNEGDLHDAEVTSMAGTVKVRLAQARESASDVVYTRERHALWPVLLSIIIAGALVSEGSFAATIGMVAVLLLLVREVQR